MRRAMRVVLGNGLSYAEARQIREQRQRGRDAKCLKGRLSQA
jgi:hypothetical protein